MTATQEALGVTLPMEDVFSALGRLTGETARQLEQEAAEEGSETRYFLATTNLFCGVDAASTMTAGGEVVVMVAEDHQPITQLRLLLEQLERHCTTSRGRR